MRAPASAPWRRSLRGLLLFLFEPSLAFLVATPVAFGDLVVVAVAVAVLPVADWIDHGGYSGEKPHSARPRIKNG
jgi:hypothetical protein